MKKNEEIYHRWRALKYSIQNIADIVKNPELITNRKMNNFNKKYKKLRRRLERLKKESDEMIEKRKRSEK